ncbi:MAG: 5-oxoprolinase subunit PxpB [bacterium]|nr:5-oxoprolinase subunit PxpB [bacterium]
MRFLFAGESHLVVEFGDKIDLHLNKMVHFMANEIASLGKEGIIETIPTYRSLLISFNPLVITVGEVQTICERTLDGEKTLSPVRAVVVEVPTLYGGEGGPDLLEVAEQTGLTTDEVIQIHCEKNYPIYMIGFMPGYPYLGGLSSKIAVGRLKVPRTKVPGGSVGIAEQQTGIYPIDSPGGWRIIGHTPLKLYNPHASPPSVLKAGQYVRFLAVSQEEYDEICLRVADGTYITKIEECKEGVECRS